jgi:mono/diheme cytochrome c family protein
MTVKRISERHTRGPVVLTTVAMVVSLAAIWFLGRAPSEVDQAHRRFDALQRQVAAARDSRQARQADRGRVMRLRAQARAASGAQRAAFEAEASAIEDRLGWSDGASVRAAVLSQPLIAIAARLGNTGGSSTATAGIVASRPRAGAGNGCLSCHLTIDVPGYETYPAPFRTHPKLAHYVGASSPHPPSRVRCESCHQGDGFASTFAGAGHAKLTADDPAAAPAANDRSWRDPAATGAMLPAGRIEAACVTCHAGERYQPGAPALNEALVTVERGGCYACHDIDGMKESPRRGPDLRRIAAKLTREWVSAWLANPRALKPATWMPRFWNSDTLSSDDAAAIDAVTAYLFERSEAYVPAAGNAARGDAARGKTLVESVGCLGCHVVGGASRDETSVRRTFGQPLDGIGSKTTAAWLFDWVREPARYSPTTRMPNLRLDAAQAADVTAYLLTLTGTVPAAAAADDRTDERYRSVIARYAPADGRDRVDPATLTGAPLKSAAGRVVIAAVGCFNCHEIAGFEGRRTAVPMTARPVWTDGEARAVHASGAQRLPGNGAPRLPDFALGARESARLALALTTVAGRARDTHALSTPWHLAKVAGRRLVQERNCVGCHEIDAIGGDLVALLAEPTLGPPLLTPEGSRVKAEWLRGFLRQPSTIRPWLSVRMPTFGWSDDDIDIVRGYFVEIAPPNPAPVPRAPDVTAAGGRELFDLLKCQQCHVLGAIPKDQPTANLAPDLRMARERLQPDWILAWLRNPSAILPGTRMPTFWPDYPKSFYPQYGGDASAQVRAIRDHLLTLR